MVVTFDTETVIKILYIAYDIRYHCGIDILLPFGHLVLINRGGGKIMSIIITGWGIKGVKLGRILIVMRKSKNILLL